jgi:hypothetical protein
VLLLSTRDADDVGSLAVTASAYIAKSVFSSELLTHAWAAAEAERDGRRTRG